MLVPHPVSHFQHSTDTIVLPTLLLEPVNAVEVGKEHEMTFSMAELCLPPLPSDKLIGHCQPAQQTGFELEHKDTAQPEPPEQSLGFGSLEDEAGTT